MTQDALINDLKLLSSDEFSLNVGAFSKNDNTNQVEKYRAEVQAYPQSSLNADSEEWFKAATARIGDLTNIVNALFNEIKANAESEYSSAIVMLIVNALLLTISCILLLSIYSVLRSRQTQSNELKAKLSTIKKENDLTLLVEKFSSDDLGDVAELVNELISNFKNDLHIFQEAANEIAAASLQSAYSSEETSNNIQEQQQRVTSTLASTEVLNIGIEGDLETMSNMSSHTRESGEVVQKGENLVIEAVAGIEETAVEVKNVGQTIEYLNEKVGDILKMVDVIGGVAEQTNLLALNAAIEAARAGEQGRGFAVVADEVRALAKRTQENTQQISKVVDELNTSSDKAFKAIAKGVEKADDAVEFSQKIQLALGEVSIKIQELKGFSDAVEQSAEQQSFSLKQIVDGVRNIDELSSENSESSGQLAAASHQLSETSSNMLEQIQRYRT